MPRISQFATLDGGNIAPGDYIPIIDVSEPQAGDRNKKVTFNGLSAAILSDYASLSGGIVIYPDTATAEGAASEGDYFYVPSSVTGEALILYRIVSGSAAEISRLPDVVGVDVFTSGVFEIVSAADVVAHCPWFSTPEEMAAIRKGEQSRSYYKEALDTATRGSRAEMPVNKWVLARGTLVAVYDLDSGTPELWKSWTTSGATRVCAANGKLYYAATGGLYEIDLISDVVERVNATNRSRANQSAAAYNQSTATFAAVATTPIVNATVNAISAATLPGTPDDPVRGLPNPTVDVSTADGISRIMGDGTAFDMVDVSGDEYNSSAILADGSVVGVNSTQGNLDIFSRWNTFADTTTPDAVLDAASTPALLANPASTSRVVALKGLDFALGQTTGLNIVYGDYRWASAGVCRITNTYNTGVLINPVLALAESTADVTSLVGSGELVTNGDFASDIAGWTNGSTGAGGSIAWNAGGGLDVISDGVDTGIAYQTIATVVGQRYNITHTISAVSGGSLHIYIGTSLGDGTNFSFARAVGTHVETFVATATTTYIQYLEFSSGTSTVDSISVKLVASDRSIAGNHLTINGTVTRAAVATGAELAAYGGFSASNYLEQAYDADFDFGTGDFSIAFWLKEAANSAEETIVERDSASTAARWTVNLTAAGLLNFIVDDGTTTITSASTAALDDSIWHHVVCMKTGTLQQVWIDGVRVDSDTAPTLTLNNASAVLRIGESVGGSDPLTNGSLANLRISATAPTPEQIRAMYEAEKGMFVANSDCLLPAASVSALSYDKYTDLLHVATTGGMARLRGCEVVSKDATVVTGIAAQNGYVGTFDSNSADISVPAKSLIGHNGGPAMYDRTRFKHRGFTANATPTVLSRFPLAQGEEITFVLRTLAVMRADGAEVASYEHIGTARRTHGGSAALVGSVTERVIQEVTNTMAVTVTASGNSLIVTATGVASSNIEWNFSWELVTND